MYLLKLRLHHKKLIVLQANFINDISKIPESTEGKKKVLICFQHFTHTSGASESFSILFYSCPKLCGGVGVWATVVLGSRLKGRSILVYQDFKGVMNRAAPLGDGTQCP